MTRTETISVIDFLIRAIWFIDNPSYLETLARALHTILIRRDPLQEDQFSWISKIGERTGIKPFKVKRQRGNYYRPLYDTRFSSEDRLRAALKWEHMVIERTQYLMRIEWYKPIRAMNKLRDAGVDRDILDDLLEYMRDRSVIPKEHSEGYGKVRLIS